MNSGNMAGEYMNTGNMHTCVEWIYNWHLLDRGTLPYIEYVYAYFLYIRIFFMYILYSYVCSLYICIFSRIYTHESIRESPLTEEIRLEIFGSPDYAVFL